MEEIKVEIQKPIIDKLHEMCDFLKIDQNELINLCLIDGYSLYWFLYKKKIMELSDIPKERLVEQFHDRYELLQEIETIEDEFERRYPFGHFTSNYERYKTFLDFINAFKDIKTIKAQEGSKQEVAPTVIPERKEIRKEKKIRQPITRRVKQFLINIVEFLFKIRIPLILFSFLSTFLIFWLIRNYLNPIHMLRYTPYNFIGYMFLFVFTLFMMGVVYLILVYYIRKIRERAPYRADKRVYKIYKKEFNTLNPKNSYENETDRIIALGEFLEAKKRALPFTRH